MTRLRPIPDALKKAHLYLMASSDEIQSKKQREDLRKDILPWLQTLEPDEDGNFLYEFPEPITLDEVTFSGLQAQRRVSEYVDEERARELIDKHGLEDRCIETVVDTVVDYDELYAANQEGIIPDEEIDSIIETDISYALVKVKC